MQLQSDLRVHVALFGRACQRTDGLRRGRASNCGPDLGSQRWLLHMCSKRMLTTASAFRAI